MASTTTQKKKSGNAIYLYIARALVAKWATIVAALETDDDDPTSDDIEDPWPAGELVSTLTRADICDAASPTWSGQLGIAVEVQGGLPDPADLDGGGVYHWLVDVIPMFAAAENSEDTTRMKWHYVRCAEASIVSYHEETVGPVSGVESVEQLAFVRNRVLSPGIQGATLGLRVQAQHKI